MMATKATYLRVGLMLIGGTALALALILFLGKDRVRGGIGYESYFRESVQGLEIGAPVKFRGVTLGQVSEIGLATALYLRDQEIDPGMREARLVVVRWKIDPRRIGSNVDNETAIQRGLRARLASQGITGLAYVELDFADPARNPPEKVSWTPEYTYIPSVPSTISQVQDAATALAARLNEIDLVRIANTVQTVLDDLHGQLTSGDIKTALSGLAGLATALRESVAQADLPGLAAEIRATAAAARGTFDSTDSRSLAAASTQAAERLAAATAKLPPLITALEATVRRANAGAADVQADLVPVLRDARAAAANLRETTETLRRYPSSVLLGAPPPANGGRR
jgi:ABC-type transporter Mla subunit MlaD